MTTPILLVPGLNCTAEIYAQQIVPLWTLGSVSVANHTLGTTMGEIAAAILADAPPRFALAGISMGGYIAFEILRQAPERVLKLALIDTSARADTPEATARRLDSIALAEQGKFTQVMQQSFPMVVHPAHVNDAELRALHVRMGTTIGVATYVQQQRAIIARPDSRPGLGAIAVPASVIFGDADALTPPDLSREMAAGIPGARLVEIREAGHMALVEQPKQVAAALLAAFQG